MVTITRIDTGETRSTTTNADGTFVAAAMPAARYDVVVKKPGFQTYKETELAVHPALVTTVNPVLRIGELSTAVEVAASATRVETTTPEISGQISSQQAESLPLNGRNFQALGSLMPGITNLQVGSALGGGSDQDGQYMAINGMGASGKRFT